MTHDELLAKIDYDIEGNPYDEYMSATRAVVELHSPGAAGLCDWCTCRDCTHMVSYPCKTIQKIEDKLK
jgi:hypothetical protein